MPFINTVPLVFTCFFACVYRASLIIHEKNTEKNKDPFRNMTFDPEVCFNMGCDYYFLTIELKCILIFILELEGILINYQ